MPETGTANAVVFVLNRQRGAPAQPNIAYRLVAPGKPEILHLHVLVTNFALLRPEGRILGGLGVNSSHGEIGSVDPNLAAIEVLAVRFRVDGEHVLAARFGRLEAD